MWKKSTLNVKIDAICEKITLNVKKIGSLKVSNILTLNVLKSTLYVQTLFWRYLWKSNLMLAKSLNGKHIYPLHLHIIMITVHIMHLYVNWDMCEYWPDTTPFMINILFWTMFKFIVIDPNLLLAGLSCELGQQNNQISLLWGPGEWNIL